MASQRINPEVCSSQDKVYNELLSLNNRASSQLMAGDIQGASTSFSGALRALKQSMSTQAASAPPSKRARTSPKMLPRIACVFGNQADPSASVPENGQFVYGQPIHLVHSLGCDQTQLVPEHQIVETISYTIIYNLALCRHLYALTLLTRTSTSDSMENKQEQQDEQLKVRLNLLQAASMYAHAQALLSQQTHRREHGALHGLTILNNLGHVFARLGDATKSKTYFETLFNAIICIKTSGTAILESSCLPRDNGAQERAETVMAGFLSSILSYWLTSSSNASAA
jgi:hypothetical protein